MSKTLHSSPGIINEEIVINKQTEKGIVWDAGKIDGERAGEKKKYGRGGGGTPERAKGQFNF